MLLCAHPQAQRSIQRYRRPRTPGKHGSAYNVPPPPAGIFADAPIQRATAPTLIVLYPGPHRQDRACHSRRVSGARKTFRAQDVYHRQSARTDSRKRGHFHHRAGISKGLPKSCAIIKSED